MGDPRPSAQVRELIRAVARRALDSDPAWLNEFEQVMLAAAPPLAQDPDLAATISRANRANLIHFATANVQNPGDPVPPDLGAETLRMARDLIQRGLDTLILDVYRIGQNVAWQRWTDIAFGLTSDTRVLHDLLDTQFRAVNTFVDTTIAGIPPHMQSEHRQLSRYIRAENRKIVELLLSGAPMDREHAEARLGYLLDRPHTAAIIWTDRPDTEPSQLDRVVEAVGGAIGCPSPLTVIANPTTRWIWAGDVCDFDVEQLEQLLDTYEPQARMTIGATATGIDGFRRSHLDARTTRRTLARLGSLRRITLFADIQVVALVTEDPRGADHFISDVLGNLASASAELHTALLTFINQQCNVSLAAEVLYLHRSTLRQRIETAQRMLPRPLSQTIVHVAVALETLRWRGDRTASSAKTPIGRGRGAFPAPRHPGARPLTPGKPAADLPNQRKQIVGRVQTRQPERTVEQPLSPRVQDLIRMAAWTVLNPTREWVEEFDRRTLAACAPLFEDPALAAVVSRSNRGNLIHFASAILRNPGGSVPPNLSPTTLRMARDLARRGLDGSVLEVYRIGQNVAWRRWTEIAFQLTSDHDELRELLDVPFRSAHRFVDATLAAIAGQVQAESAALPRGIRTERYKVVELILEGAPISNDRVQAQLDYAFNRTHTAAIIWCGENDEKNHDRLDRVAAALSEAVGCRQPLVVIASAAARWVWIHDVGELARVQLQDVLDTAPGTRIALGAAAPGIDGFRRSHRQALATRHMLTRLRSPHRVAFFADIQLVALLTENPEGADDFIKATLGDLAAASQTLHETVLTYIKAACNASRAAKLLYTHRNTLRHRLETAEQLLPRPLSETTVAVALAIEALQWRSARTSFSPQHG